MRKIERGEGRLELDKNSGYLLLRDRLDPDVLHMPVWSTEHKTSITGLIWNIRHLNG